MTTWTYDAAANIAYLRLVDRPVVESEEVRPDVVFDFDADGHVIGIEFLDARAALTPELLAPAA